ncbi:gluconate 2-dehydrogenase subunit 3 family protein [Spirosoma sp. SC4-14]|uniref:gluconate 2-dehydrogenase subunit 3 family protein n=1 Tax=Spirosoma sp. SC4-14 TaxID=3128900 RepID=UPI0030CCC02A
MQRRSAIKNVALAFGGLISLPAWASGWTPDSIGTVSTLLPTEEDLLADIVETIIPETSTPGAKSLKVHQFVMRMIQDCYGEPAQTGLKQGLVVVDDTAKQAYSKAFADCDSMQRLDTLTKLASLPDPLGKQFVDMVKNLTIQGYTSSEYYMVNQLKFNMAPGFYHGCVPISN